jgi:hypothetical protein
VQIENQKLGCMWIDNVDRGFAGLCK